MVKEKPNASNGLSVPVELGIVGLAIRGEDKDAEEQCSATGRIYSFNPQVKINWELFKPYYCSVVKAPFTSVADFHSGSHAHATKETEMRCLDSWQDLCF